MSYQDRQGERDVQFMDAVQGGLTSAIDRGAGRTGEYGRVFTALLFALFVITLLLAIMAGTRVYSALSDMRSQTEQDERLHHEGGAGPHRTVGGGAAPHRAISKSPRHLTHLPSRCAGPLLPAPRR